MMVTRKNAFYVDNTGTIDPTAWLNHITMQRPEGRLRLIRQALVLAQSSGSRQCTPSGLVCVQQGLVMADILFDFMVDEETICAALLYHTVYYAALDLSLVENQLNQNITRLLKGALRMNDMSTFLSLKKIKHSQIEKFRKMVFSMAQDVRVVLLKLAERVAWMRANKQQNLLHARERLEYARETLIVYASLANRLGLHALRYELEDLAMEQLAPSLYAKLAQAIKERLVDRETYVGELALAIEITLPKLNIAEFKITHRVKNFYGTYRKMRHKKLPFSQIYDLNAIRIVVNTVDECYQILEMIQTLWTAVPDEFDDYIKHPKPNKYRSIHIAVYGSAHKIVEIQIRTFEMDQESEHGLAAHWEYKEGVGQTSDYQAKIAWLRQVMLWKKELVKNGIYLMPELTTTLDDRVYVLTPSGEIVELPKGATALDFAYYLHRSTGHYCEGVLVNGVSQSLRYVLHTGEQVDVITGSKPTLRWDWLNPDLGYLNTEKAKAEVLYWFQQKDYHQHVVTGRLLFEKGCHQLGLRSVNQEQVASALEFSSAQEFFAALGQGEVRLAHVLHTLHRSQQPTPSLLEASSPRPRLQVREAQFPYGQRVPQRIALTIMAHATVNILQDIMPVLQKQSLELRGLSSRPHANSQYIILTLQVDIPKGRVMLHELVQALKMVAHVLKVHVRAIRSDNT
jgi:GTP pyrophosphokinase